MLDELYMVNWLCLFNSIDYVLKFFWVINFYGFDKFFKCVKILDWKWLLDKIKNQLGLGEKNDELILQIVDL